MKPIATVVAILFLLYNAVAKPLPERYTFSMRSTTIKWTGHAGAGSYSPSGTVRLKSGYAELNGDMVVRAWP